MEIYSLGLEFAISLVLMEAMTRLKRYRHQIYQVRIRSGNAYSFKEGRLMAEYWNQIHDFSIVSMITVLKFINRRYLGDFIVLYTNFFKVFDILLNLWL